LDRHPDVEYVLALKVSTFTYSIIFAKYIRSQLISQHLGDLFFSPDIELSLLSFRVGVLGGIEPPVGMSHFPEDKV
jgi:hypothetical protein